MKPINRDDTRRPDHEYRRDIASGWLDTASAHAAYGIPSISTLYYEVPSRVYRVARTGRGGCSKRRLFAPVGWSEEVAKQLPSEVPTPPAEVAKNLRAEAAKLTAKADAIEAAIALLAEVMA